MGDDNRSFVLRATKRLRWKLWTDLNPFSVAVFSFMYGFYLLQPACLGWKTYYSDRQGPKDTSVSNCPNCINMAENTP